MEAPRGVELTGTNGGWRHASSSPLWLGRGVVAGIRSFAALSVGVVHVAICRRLFLASAFRFPDRHGPFPPSPRGGFQLKICGDHSQGETPGPIPNPEAKALYGDGTALDRVWESSASPLHTSEGSVPVWERAPPLFCAHAHGRARRRAQRHQQQHKVVAGIRVLVCLQAFFMVVPSDQVEILEQDSAVIDIMALIGQFDSSPPFRVYEPSAMSILSFWSIHVS